MKQISQKIFFLISLFVVFIPSFSQAQSIEAPKYVIGDSWEYTTVDLWTNKIAQNTVHTIVGLVDEFVRVKFDTRNADPSTGQLGKLEISQGTQRADFTFTYASKGKLGKRVTYLWPLQVGKKWHDDFISEIRQNDGRLLQFANSNDAVVTGWEAVDTPVGKIQAIKIVHTNTITNTAGDEAPSTSVTTYWYAPSAKRHIRSEYKQVNSDGTPGTRTLSNLVSYKVN